MQHNFIGNLKTSHRVLCCLVCLILVISLICPSIKVSAASIREASLGGAPAGGSSGGGGSTSTQYVQYAADVAAFVGVAYAGYAASEAAKEVTVEDIQTFAGKWYYLTASAKNWFTNTASKIFDGEPVRVPQWVLAEVTAVCSVVFPASSLFLRPLASVLDLNATTYDDVFATNITDLLEYNLSLLSVLNLSLTDFRYDATEQYKVMHDAFYEQIVETRLALNNTLQASASGIYSRIGTFATQMETQFVETRQGLINKISSVSSDIYSNISLVRSQIVEQLIQSRNGILGSLTDIKTSIAGIGTEIGSISGILGGLTDTKDQVAAIPGLSFPSLRESLVSLVTGATSFFDDSGGNNGDDDEESYPLIPPITNYFDKAVNPFLGVIRDSEFMAALEAFFSFVASLWLLFPLAIRYLISFGFGVPMTFSVIKMFMG